MIQDLEGITRAFAVTPQNTRFFLSKTGLLMARVEKDEPFEGRVFLARAFPFEEEDRYISVLNEEKEEIGQIGDLAVFDDETVSLLHAELAKKYFAPKILRIQRLSERYGSSFWDCETDLGPLSFTVKDTYRSLIRIGEDRVMVVDHDGCRYEIESLEKLDKKSRAKLELYL